MNVFQEFGLTGEEKELAESLAPVIKAYLTKRFDTGRERGLFVSAYECSEDVVYVTRAVISKVLEEDREV